MEETGMAQTRDQARIFISCGQASNEERDLAISIKEDVESMDFKGYVAVRDNTLRGLKENIFQQLQEAEYYLFIDFKRERIVECSKAGNGSVPTALYRGSLFTNQELALASYLNIDGIGFQEAGVRRCDGIMAAIQLNCTTFEKRSDLRSLVHDKIEELVKNELWDPHWKKLLRFRRSQDDFSRRKPKEPYIFHISVQNPHRRKTAISATAYIEEVLRLPDRTRIPFSPFELKWAGTTVPFTMIRPGDAARGFDAFEIPWDKPTKLRWDLAYTDTEKVWPRVEEPGEYEITYFVASYNFPPLRARFKLNLKAHPDETRLDLLDSEQEFPSE
jgi:hypothetical protein